MAQKNSLKRKTKSDARDVFYSMSDPRWRLNHLYKIINKRGDLVTLKENTIQAAINNCESSRKMILKHRQPGVSTNEIIKMLDHACWRQNQACFVMAHRREDLTPMFAKALIAYKNLPHEIRPAIDRGEGSRYEMRFPEIRSQISCGLESRGRTINWLHISEIAFIKELDKVDSTLQCVPKDGIVTIESTPNGIGNHFYDMWNDQSSIYTKLFFPWFSFDEYKMSLGVPLEEWTAEEHKCAAFAETNYSVAISPEQIGYRRFKIAELGSDSKFLQQYPEDDASCFLSSGDAAMDLRIIVSLINDLPSQVSSQNGLSIYKSSHEHKYVIGADCSEGVGGDFSAAVVWQYPGLETVAQLVGNFAPREFAHKLVDLAKMYTKAELPTIAVERNNHGHSVLMELTDHINYQNVYHYKEDRPGWLTDSVTRPIMLDSFIEAVHNGTVTIRSRELLNECLTLINNNGKIESAPGKHDDIIMAASIGLQVAIRECAKMNVYENMLLLV